MDYTKDNLVDDQTIDSLLDDNQPVDDQEIETTEEVTQEDEDTDQQEDQSKDDQESVEIKQQKEAPKEQQKEVENKQSVDWDSDENPYKKRYSDSSREATLLSQREKGYKERFEKLNSTEVTEEDIKSEYPNIDLDIESEATKIILQDNIRAKRERQKEKLELEKTSAVTQFRTQMDLIKKNSPEIAQNEDDFYKFIMEKDPDGTIKDLSILASHYKDVVLPKKQEKQISKNPTLLKSNGGKDQSSTKKEIDVQQLQNLRKSNPAEYRKLVLSGAIKDEDIDL